MNHIKIISNAIDRLNNSGPRAFPYWIVVLQSVCFSVLYAIWMLPDTILIRHICLILGALLGCYQIYFFRGLLFNKKAISIWLLVTLFLWVCFHLFFLAGNFDLQFHEFTTIWKRSILGFIFAVGFGLALSSIGSKKGSSLYPLIYLGMIAPALIYLVKYCLTHYGVDFGIKIPDYLKLYYSYGPLYVHKIAYVAFCAPTFAVALGMILNNLKCNNFFSLANAVYVASIALILFVFDTFNIKNGMAYAFILGTIFFIVLIASVLKGHTFKKILLAFFVLGLIGIALNDHLLKNSSWRSFAVDVRISWDTSTYDHWKYGGGKGYPSNSLGQVVSITNYERVAWGKEGVGLVASNPLGYGLVEESFGHLAKLRWPDSKLLQSHSGWIDLTLGIGLPGILLLMSSLLLTMVNLNALSNSKMGSFFSGARPIWWILLALALIWCTTEISQKVYLDMLLFWLGLGGGYVLGVNDGSRCMLSTSCA